jgi:hypothetical protein
MMGGALGLAVLASLAASRTDTLTADGDSHLAALTGGYHAAFVVGAIFAVSAVAIGVLLLRTAQLPGGAHDDDGATAPRATAEVAS